MRGAINPFVCFAAGTHVITGINADGTFLLKKIEDIEEGDEVLARDQYDEGDGVQLRKVTKLFRNASDHLRVVTIRDRDGNVETIRTTDEHPFWVESINGGQGGWIAAKDLKGGDRLNEGDGSNDAIVLSSTRQEIPQGVEVYNFEVEGDHTYFVEDGVGRVTAVWVHNKCTISYVKGAKGKYPAVDAFADQLRHAVDVAERYLSKGGTAGSPMAALYHKLKHVPFLGRMFKGSAIQQIADTVLKRKGILPTAATANKGSRLGLKALRPLRPDYQLDVGSGQWAIGDITSAGSAGKALKYDHSSSPVIFEALY